MKELKFALSLLSPRMWGVLLVLAALVLAVGAGAGGYVGYRVAQAKGEVRVSQAKEDLAKVRGELAAEQHDRTRERLTHEKQLAEALSEVTQTEKRWADKLRTVEQLYEEHNNVAKKQIDSLRADVLTGAVRLSVAVRAASAAGHCAAGADSTTASGPGEEARAELVPQVAYDLIGIAADGDDAVRAFNACHDAYEAIRLGQSQAQEQQP